MSWTIRKRFVSGAWNGHITVCRHNRQLRYCAEALTKRCNPNSNAHALALRVIELLDNNIEVNVETRYSIEKLYRQFVYNQRTS